MEGRKHKWTVRKVLGKWQLYVLLLPAVVWLALFAYYPMYGLLIAFKDYKGNIDFVKIS